MIFSISGVLKGGATNLSGSRASYNAENNADDALNTYNGIARNGLTYSTGKIGNAFLYNGTGSDVLVPDTTLKLTGSFTVSAWVYQTSRPSNTWLFYSYPFQAGAGQRGWGLLIETTGRVAVYYVDRYAGNRYMSTGGNIVPLNKWTLVTFTWDPTTGTHIFYLNGTAVYGGSFGSSEIWYASPDSLNTPTIGSANYNGKLDAVNIWNKTLSAAEVLDLYNCGNGKQYPFPVSNIDEDVCKFTSAAIITDPIQLTAVSQLVSDLKSTGLWSKMKAIYPFVGGTAHAHKFNLKDPRDLDAAFRLGFYGNMNHTNAGAVPNGSDSYAGTYLMPSVTLTSSQHVSFYSVTNRGTSISNTLSEIEIGGISSGDGIPGISMGFNSNAWNSGTPNYFISRLSGGGYASYGLPPIVDTRGFGVLSRTDINSVRAFWNGANYGVSSQSYIPVPVPLSIFGRAYNVTNAEPHTISRKTCAFASIGDGLTDAEVSTLYTIVQAYETTLGRAV